MNWMSSYDLQDHLVSLYLHSSVGSKAIHSEKLASDLRKRPNHTWRDLSDFRYEGRRVPVWEPNLLRNMHFFFVFWKNNRYGRNSGMKEYVKEGHKSIYIYLSLP